MPSVLSDQQERCIRVALHLARGDSDMVFNALKAARNWRGVSDWVEVYEYLIDRRSEEGIL